MYRKFCEGEMAVAIICLVTSVAVIFIAAVMRAAGHPINWGTDIALLLFTWSTFLGADLAFRQGKLINVDLLFNQLPQNMKKFMKLVIYAICLFFLCSMVYLGFVQSVKTWYRSFQGIPFLSYTWVTLSVPVACLSMTVTTIIKIVRTIRGEDELTFL
ncbi:TRAP transporter small permease subunit [Clostridium sp. AM58-1XD]|uniref:TRAP transporter small permease n=1 Tax=Clostridium sp. AM58-1XD TaxID=2292307 RepID=UPI001FA81A1F|nr:TRAP transporter small permease subunit [Clostridium sp. AM58-1XD]